ncbi:MAG: aldo/keto reductase [Lachnospiraceae bacterium]|nr:aldo/keto reductase [Lachnospiraceae bacterium]
MKYNINPRNGDRLSVLGYGCMRFGGDHIARSFAGGFDKKKAEELLVSAVEQGVNYFDTAYVYSGSEEILGSTLQKHGLREKVFLATKLPLMLCRKADDLDKFFEIQLKRLQTEYIDYYLLHMLTDMKTWNRLCEWGIREWIAKLKIEGRIRNIGFSFHGAQQEFLDLLDAYDWDFCQIQYNYSDENYQAGVKGLRAAAAKNLPVIIMEPLLGGKLAKNLPEEAVKRFKETRPELSPAAWGFRWLYNQPEVTVVLSGMNEPEQLEDNVRIADTAGHGILTEEEMAAIANVKAVFERVYKIHCTGCHYCMPCPAGVDIPSCFAAYNSRFSISKSQGLFQYTMSTLMNDKPAYASLCRKCGACERHCPQNIKIRKELEAVSREFEGVPFKIMKKVVPLFMRKS